MERLEQLVTCTVPTWAVFHEGPGGEILTAVPVQAWGLYVGEEEQDDGEISAYRSVRAMVDDGGLLVAASELRGFAETVYTEPSEEDALAHYASRRGAL